MPKDKRAPVFGMRDWDPSRLCALDMAGPIAGLATLWAAGSMISQQSHEDAWAAVPQSSGGRIAGRKNLRLPRITHLGFAVSGAQRRIIMCEPVLIGRKRFTCEPKWENCPRWAS